MGLKTGEDMFKSVTVQALAMPLQGNGASIGPDLTQVNFARFSTKDIARSDR